MEDDELLLFKKLLGKHLKGMRSLKDFSQEELAYRTGLHPKFISQIERGKQLPSAYTLFLLSGSLAFSIDRIYATITSEMQQPPSSE